MLTICVDRISNKYSIRNEEGQFYGIDKTFVGEFEQDKIWETDDQKQAAELREVLMSAIDTPENVNIEKYTVIYLEPTQRFGSYLVKMDKIETEDIQNKVKEYEGFVQFLFKGWCEEVPDIDLF